MVGFALRRSVAHLALLVWTYFFDDTLDGSRALSDADLIVDDFSVDFVDQ
jgi:hypothetical protein